MLVYLELQFSFFSYRFSFAGFFFNLTIVIYYIPSERLCNVEQKLPNKFSWKSVSF